jgi:acetyl esterase
MAAESFYPLYKEGRLDRQAETLLREIAEGDSPPLTSLTPRQARRGFLVRSWLGEPKKLSRIERRSIPGPGGPIALRVYVPEGEPPFPVLVFFHGGGFVLGTLDDFEPFCTFLASGASGVVVSVDYRLAPEHKHPAAVDDAWAAVQWVAGHAEELGGDAGRIAVAGDSAGGNLAAVVSMLARDAHSPALTYQVLICPWVDLDNCESDSFRWFGEGLWLSKTNIQWYRDHYLQNGGQARHPRVSPLLAEDLRGLPPALIINAEFDVLRDQGEAYARRLEKAGVPVLATRYKGTLHDFVTLPGLFDQAWKAIEQIDEALKTAFRR